MQRKGWKMFHNEELNKIYEESKPIVKTHLENLDYISNDIMTLEKIMGAYAIPYIKLWINDTACLIWDSERIKFGDDSILLPLIECKAHYRIKYSKYLDDLFNLGMEKLKKVKNESIR